MKKWKCLKSEIAYDSRYMRIRKDMVELPNGEQKEWTFWDSPDSALVIGMTAEKKLVMIKQYRYMVNDEVIEFPAGYNNKTETIKAGAKREFEEETGYACDKLIKLGAFYETYGQLNRRIHIFFAPNVVKLKAKLVQEDDVIEDTEVLLVRFENAVEMALKNEIVHTACAAGILLLKEKIERKEIII